MTATVHVLRLERGQNTLGLGVSRPRLTWQVLSHDPSWSQTGYEIEIHRASGLRRFRAEGADSVFVPWPDAPLESRETAQVRVRVRNGEDVSEWSSPAFIDVVPLHAGDWTARAIGPGAQFADRDGRPSLVRREFVAPDHIRRAVLRATAHGLFEAEINGQRVGDDVLAPGWTSYPHRLRITSYDVTDLIRAGRNAIGAWLADGWWRGRIGFEGGTREFYGNETALFAELELTDGNGQVTTVITDDSWRTHPSPIHRSGLYDGERYDAGSYLPGWSRAGFDDTAWVPVTATALDPGLLVAPEGPPVRCTQELRAVSISSLPDQRYVFDFGQNFAGRLRLRAATSEAGQTITIRHAEVLQGGELYTRPLRLAASVDEYVADGGPIDWEPRFTIHGFRYAEVAGWTGDIRDLEVLGRVIHSDMRPTGTFSSSNPLLDRLHENVVWSMRSNFVDIPTDCPQRDERLGWTGDIQVFAPTAAGLYDVSGFLASWLKDVAAEQLPDGTVPWYVPAIPGGPYWTPIKPGAVWGDVAVLTPWTLYQHYADRQVLADQYRSAKAWVDLVAHLAGPSHLWDTGMQLGDWLDPTAPPEDPTVAKTDKYLVASAYFAQSARILSLIASELAYSDDAEHYAAMAGKARAAFRTKYVRPNGLLANHAQAAYALAISFDLFSEHELLDAGAHLHELVADNDYRIGTGFAGTPLIADALTKAGRTDDAYRLLLERECPSWLYTVLSGATTIWERWDSLLPDGSVNPGDMTSFNHYALGSVASWLHSTVAGIGPLEPGFRRIRIAPRPGGGLTSVSRRIDTPYGLVSSTWALRDGLFDLAVEVPTGTTAEVVLPSGQLHHVHPGRHRFTEPHTMRSALQS